jgi:hypothetical protein
MTFAQPLTLRFNYGATSPAGARLAAQRAAGAGMDELNIYWHNGIEYLRLGGLNNPGGQYVTLKVTRPGEYQLRRAGRPTVFGLTAIDPKKVFTPGIAPYEKITFFVDNPDGDKVTGKVLDLRGEFVADLAAIGDPTAISVTLEWAGRDCDGKDAPKGVYLYQIKGSGKTINGTIMVAR